MEKQEPLLSQNSKELSILDLVKMVSPGTIIRSAIDDIVRTRMGALIVFYSSKLEEIIEGGFKINSRLTHQKLVELSKMDGAVVISNDRKKILHANVLLVPNKNIASFETGTRHKAAERTAKQAETLTIAVSERKNTVTLYYKDLKYILKKTEELISRATESLQILEKQREIYDNLIFNLNILEITNLTRLKDVCMLLRRIETMKKIADKINRYTIELGSEGLVIKMRLKELIFNVQETEEDILKDYSSQNISKIKSVLSKLTLDELLDLENISKIISPLAIEEATIAKGYRFLKKINLQEEQTIKIIKEFGNLENILNALKERLIKTIGTDAEKFIAQRDEIKEKILAGEKL